MRRPKLALQLTVCATLFACGSGESSGAAQGSVQSTRAPDALRGWAPRSLSAPAASSSGGLVQVGGRRVRGTIGLPTSGRPSLSLDGAWAVWTGEHGVTIRNVQTGAIRVVPLPRGMRARDAAFFGASAGELGIAMSEETPEGDERNVIVVYDTATLRVTYALSTDERYAYCSLVLGSVRDLLCVVDRASETHSSYVLAIAGSTHAARIVALATNTGIAQAVASEDGTHLFHSAARGEHTPATLVDVDLASGSAASFPAPMSGEENYVTGLAITPNASHLAVGTFGGALSLHALPSGRILRSAEPYGGERQIFAVSSDLSLWDYRTHLSVHAASGPMREGVSPCDSFNAIRVTARNVVTASYEGLCVFDRTTLALDATRSMSFKGTRAYWRGDEIQIVSSSLNIREAAVPQVLRWNVVTGAFGVDHTYSAMMAAMGTSATLPASFVGEITAQTPMLWEVSGDRATATPHSESRTVLLDLATGRTLGRIGGAAVFRSRGAEILEAAYDSSVPAQNAGLVLRSSRNGALLRTIRPLTDYVRLVVLAPDERSAILTYESHAEWVSLADGNVTPLRQGGIHDAVIRPDGAELALGVFCDDDEECTMRVLRFALPAGTLTSTLMTQERALLAYAPTGDALALVTPTGVIIQPLSEGWALP